MFRPSEHHEAPQAVASTPPPADTLTAPADDAGGRGNSFFNLAPVEGIEPVDGWVLMTDWPFRNPRYEPAEFYARGPKGDVHLDVARYAANFSFTQERFAWFVRNDFPYRRGITPWNGADVDALILQGRAQ